IRVKRNTKYIFTFFLFCLSRNVMRYIMKLIFDTVSFSAQNRLRRSQVHGDSLRFRASFTNRAPTRTIILNLL
ncbi:hypothetical protein L9F63_023866, partial [Diploptera punctata]